MRVPDKRLINLVMLSVLFTISGHAARYSNEPGFDRPGPAYQSFEQTSKVYQSHELCRDACDSQPKCRSYTYVQSPVAGANPSCQLKDQEFAPVEDFCCISAVKGGQPKIAATPSLHVEWLGLDADRLGRDALSAPLDGAPDHHFRLTLRIGAVAKTVLAIELAEPAFVARPRRWRSRGGARAELLVELGQVRLNTPERKDLGSYSGEPVFDLYVHDSGLIDVQRSLEVSVMLQDGRTLTHQYTLTPAPDRLSGRWQMLCDPTSPDAFEPMQGSGRLLLIVADDGAVSGFFAGAPLSGRVQADGQIAGNAIDANTEIAWQGQLKSPRRGLPLEGGGDFQATRLAGGCAGAGNWSDH